MQVKSQALRAILKGLYYYLLLCFRCFSFVGRRGRGQTVSLSRQGCVFQQIIQHELLHALGFNHEQTRSDRDQHVRILLQNVIPGGSYYRNSFLFISFWKSEGGLHAAQGHRLESKPSRYNNRALTWCA